MIINVSEFGKDIKIITDYLNEQGFYPDDAYVVDYMWKSFSTECYCAGWLMVEEHTLKEFLEYIVNTFNNTYLMRRLDS